MRITILVTILMLSGCISGSGELTGKQEKNGGPVRVERYGTMSLVNFDVEPSCPAEQVQWCIDRAGEMSCQCVLAKQADQKMRRMSQQMRNPRIHH